MPVTWRTAEQIRRGLAPITALVASSLAVLCTVSMVDVVTQLASLSRLTEHFAGWFVVGGLLTVITTLVTVAGAQRTGAGPALSLAAVLSVFGLALGGAGLAVDVQLPVTLPLLGIAVGGLLGGGLAMTLELPLGSAKLTLFAWGLPLLAGWPLHVWVALHHEHGDALRLLSTPPWWLIAPAAALVLVWGVATMLLEPPAADTRAVAWQASWQALVLVLGAGFLLLVILGANPQTPAGWLRPLILVATALTAGGLLLITALIPGDRARLAYVATSLVLAGLPTVLSLLVVVGDAGDNRVGILAAVALVLVAGLAAAVGSRAPLTAMAVGLPVLALGCALAWVAPGHPWVMMVAALPLTAAAAAVGAAGLFLATVSPAAVRFVGSAGVSALVLGLLLAVPLGWALAGDLAVSTDDARATVRVYLGVGCAASLLAAAYGQVVVGRIRRREIDIGSRDPGTLIESVSPDPAPLHR